jgi:predicted HicB family RNase H-like nuclease
MSKLKKIPKLRTEDEESEFWSTHDSTEYVDDCIELCKEQGKEPLRSYKAVLMFMYHQKYTGGQGLSLNQLVQKAIERELIHKE